MPKCVVTEHEKHWSLARMRPPSLIRLYTAICWLANTRYRDNQFVTTKIELKGIADMRPSTYRNALEGLQRHGLIFIPADQGEDEFRIQLCDPFTSEPVRYRRGADVDDPGNYFHKGTRFDFNRPEIIEQMLFAVTGDPSPRRTPRGDLFIKCPFHSGDSDPSCSVHPEKRVFHCYGCKKGGHVTVLLAELQGMSRRDVYRQIADAAGQELEFHQPDRRAVAIYDYVDRFGNLVKQVLRYPTKPDGSKDFRQRQNPSNWNLKGVKPILYHRDLLAVSHTVCICEGEKDADAVTNLHLNDGSGPIIGTTSGGSDTWRDILADDLTDKRVILMPDADEPGAEYEAQVTASLRKRGIPFRVVKFDDVEAKDVSEFLEEDHTVEELVERMGTDWVLTPTGKNADDDQPWRNDAVVTVV